MSIYAPPENWAEQKPHGFEKMWVVMALVWCIVMFLMMPYWHFYGKQNSTGESYRVTPRQFNERVTRFVEQYKVGEMSGVPIVEPPPGSDIYLRAMMWSWYPVLKLKKDAQYRLHISSMDVQHGFSLLPINLNLQILPGYDHVVTITPTQAGEYTIVCNEFCGIGHHRMTGKILVESSEGDR